MLKKLFFIMVIALTVSTAGAQNKQIFFDRYSTLNGLPENFVEDLAEDSDGYMWMGTQNGLVKYDGYNFKVYQLGNQKLNMQTNTTALFIFRDKKNNIWVSTLADGLFLYNRATDKFTQYSYPEKRQFSYFVPEQYDDAGNIWGFFADTQARLAKFDINKQKVILVREQGKFVYLSADLAKTADGRIWVGGKHGLYAYKNGALQGKYMLAKDTAQQREVNNIYEPPSDPGVLWVGSLHSGKDLTTARFNYKTGQQQIFRHSSQPGSILNDTVYSIYEDKQKRLWFATGQGLSKYNKATNAFVNYIPADTLKTAGKTNS